MQVACLKIVFKVIIGHNNWNTCPKVCNLIQQHPKTAASEATVERIQHLYDRLHASQRQCILYTCTDSNNTNYSRIWYTDNKLSNLNDNTSYLSLPSSWRHKSISCFSDFQYACDCYTNDPYRMNVFWSAALMKRVFHQFSIARP